MGGIIDLQLEVSAVRVSDVLVLPSVYLSAWIFLCPSQWQCPVAHIPCGTSDGTIRASDDEILGNEGEKFLSPGILGSLAGLQVDIAS